MFFLLCSNLTESTSKFEMDSVSSYTFSESETTINGGNDVGTQTSPVPVGATAAVESGGEVRVFNTQGEEQDLVPNSRKKVDEVTEEEKAANSKRRGPRGEKSYMLLIFLDYRSHSRTTWSFPKTFYFV